MRVCVRGTERLHEGKPMKIAKVLTRCEARGRMKEASMKEQNEGSKRGFGRVGWDETGRKEPQRGQDNRTHAREVERNAMKRATMVAKCGEANEARERILWKGPAGMEPGGTSCSGTRQEQMHARARAVDGTQ